MGGALARGFASAELHHHQGPDRRSQPPAQKKSRAKALLGLLTQPVIPRLIRGTDELYGSGLAAQIAPAGLLPPKTWTTHGSQATDFSACPAGPYASRARPKKNGRRHV